MPSTANSSKCATTFRVTASVADGDRIGVIGSAPELGGWDISKVVMLDSSPETYPLWYSPRPIYISSNKDVKYLYVVFGKDKLFHSERMEDTRSIHFKCREAIVEDVLSEFLLDGERVVSQCSSQYSDYMLNNSANLDGGNTGTMSSPIRPAVTSESGTTGHGQVGSSGHSSIPVSSPKGHISTQPADPSSTVTLTEADRVLIVQYRLPVKLKWSFVNSSVPSNSTSRDSGSFVSTASPHSAGSTGSLNSFQPGSHTTGVEYSGVSQSNPPILSIPTVNSGSSSLAGALSPHSSRIHSSPSITQASNRIWTVEWDEEALLAPKANVQSLRHLHVKWIGTLDVPVPPECEEEVTRLLEPMNCVPVFLPPEVQHSFYTGYCKDLLWPLFHNIMDVYGSQPSRWWNAGRQSDRWKAYKDANQRFATAIMEQFHTGDLVWIHDYHLLLVPTFLSRRHISPVGLFLHVPFPSSEVFRSISIREELLRGFLAADLIGFHLFEYARHFLTSCRRLLGLSYQPRRGGTMAVEYQGREVIVAVSHAGVEPDFIRSRINLNPAIVVAAVQHWRRKFPGRRVIVGLDSIERLRGVPHKLRCLEQMLEQNPKLASSCALIQLCLRESVRPGDTQAPSTAEIIQFAERINAKYSVDGIPVVFLEIRSNFVGNDERFALWLASDAFSNWCLRDSRSMHVFEYVFMRGDLQSVLASATDGVARLVEQFGPNFERMDVNSVVFRDLRSSCGRSAPLPDTLVLPALSSSSSDGNPVGVNDSESLLASIDSPEALHRVLVESLAELGRLGHGFTVLSEFAGASRVLGGAMRINPWKTDEGVAALIRSVTVSPSESYSRSQTSQQFVCYNTTSAWFLRVMADLKLASRGQRQRTLQGYGLGLGYRLMGFGTHFKSLNIENVVAAYRRSKKRLIVTDYGGTLNVLENEKYRREAFERGVLLGGDAAPPLTAETHESLKILSEDPANTVFVISGKERGVMEAAFKDLPGVGLAAEHGYFYRWPHRPASSGGESGKDEQWHHLLPPMASEVLDFAAAIMDMYAARTNGTFVLRKTSSVSWHFADADLEFGTMQAKELHDHLVGVLIGPDSSAEVIRGSNWVEVRQKGVSKGAVLRHIINSLEGRTQHKRHVSARNTKPRASSSVSEVTTTSEPAVDRGGVGHDEDRFSSPSHSSCSPLSEHERDPSIPLGEKGRQRPSHAPSHDHNIQHHDHVHSKHQHHRNSDPIEFILILGDDVADEDMFSTVLQARTDRVHLLNHLSSQQKSERLDKKDSEEPSPDTSALSTSPLRPTQSSAAGSIPGSQPITYYEYTVTVGKKSSSAQYYADDPMHVEELFRSLAKYGRERPHALGSPPIGSVPAGTSQGIQPTISLPSGGFYGSNAPFVGTSSLPTVPGGTVLNFTIPVDASSIGNNLNAKPGTLTGAPSATVGASVPAAVRAQLEAATLMGLPTSTANLSGILTNVPYEEWSALGLGHSQLALNMTGARSRQASGGSSAVALPQLGQAGAGPAASSGNVSAMAGFFPSSTWGSGDQQVGHMAPGIAGLGASLGPSIGTGLANGEGRMPSFSLLPEVTRSTASTSSLENSFEEPSILSTVASGNASNVIHGTGGSAAAAFSVPTAGTGVKGAPFHSPAHSAPIAGHLGPNVFIAPAPLTMGTPGATASLIASSSALNTILKNSASSLALQSFNTEYSSYLSQLNALPPGGPPVSAPTLNAGIAKSNGSLDGLASSGRAPLFYQEPQSVVFGGTPTASDDQGAPSSDESVTSSSSGSETGDEDEEEEEPQFFTAPALTKPSRSLGNRVLSVPTMSSYPQNAALISASNTGGGAPIHSGSVIQDHVIGAFSSLPRTSSDSALSSAMSAQNRSRVGNVSCASTYTQAQKALLTANMSAAIGQYFAKIQEGAAEDEVPEF